MRRPRGDIIALVAARAGVDARERASLSEVLHGLTALERPFDQDADRTHVTGSAIVVGERGVVLLRHRRLGIWVQPGGHLEGGEHPADAALREAHEETGLPAIHPPTGPALVHVDAHDGGRGHRHLDLRYLLHAPQVEPAPAPGESQDCRWFTWSEGIAVADAGLRGALLHLSRRRAFGHSGQ